MCSIGGSLRSLGASLDGGISEIPPLLFLVSNRVGLTPSETEYGGQFDWGGRLLKGNGGAQRWVQRDRKPRVECKGTNPLDCKRDISSRDESRP